MKAGLQAEKFGAFLMARLRDEAIDYFDAIAAGEMRSPAGASLQADLARMSPEQRRIARRATIAALDAGLGGFLHALSEAHDLEQAIAIMIDGRDVAAQSDGLGGELFGDSGWLARFSRHGTE